MKLPSKCRSKPRVRQERYRISVQIPGELYTDLHAAAMLENTTVSALIRSKLSVFRHPEITQPQTEKSVTPNPEEK